MQIKNRLESLVTRSAPITATGWGKLPLGSNGSASDVGALAQHGRMLCEVERVTYEDAFLVGDLLLNGPTILPGEPKAGKTLLAVGLTRALLGSDATFLGFPIYKRCVRPVWGVTDAGAEGELRERFTEEEAQRVRVFTVRDGNTPAYWQGVASDLVEYGCDFFVLDNLLGSLGVSDDIAEPSTAQRIVANLRPIFDAGIPMIAVTHTPKGREDGLNTASSPSGGRALGAAFRGIVTLRRSDADGLRIKTAINRAPKDLELRVHVEPLGTHAEIPVWSLRESAAKGGKQAVAGKRRQPDTLERARTVAQRIITEESTELEWRALGRKYAVEGQSSDVLRKKLPKLVEWTGSRYAWLATPATNE